MEYNNYFYIYSFCFITEGCSRFSIYDSLHKKMHQFDMELYNVAKKLFRNKKVCEILALYNNDDGEVILSFIDYLLKNDMGRFVDDINDFPLINESWDSPYDIKRCIIDIRDIWHNFDDIFLQLSKLFCPKIEIRSYRVLTVSEVEEIVRIYEKYDFGVLFLLMPYNEILFSKKSLPLLARIIEQDYRIILNVYNVTDKNKLEFDKLKEHYSPLSYNVTLFNKRILGKEDCGVINYNNFHEMSIEDIMENKNYNGCLNRVISIDEIGNIKNCPSMSIAYGDIKTNSLIDVVARNDFKKVWYISNSMIDVCRECELRIVCLGCRAYLTNAEDIYSKPAKCNYIP